MNKEYSLKKVAVFVLLGIALIGIPLTVYVVQRQQEIRSRAEKSTTLSLTSPSQSVAPGTEVSLDISINPGVNQVNSIKLTLIFDQNTFVTDANSFTIDSASDLKIVEGPIIASGSFAVTVAIASDPTKTIRSEQRIGTIKFNIKQTAVSGSSQITFDENQTEVRSVGSTDAFAENVLSTTVPANIIIASAEASPTPTLDPSLTPSVSPTPSISPTPGVCTAPEKVTNVKVTCPNCFSSGTLTSPTSTPTPTP